MFSTVMRKCAWYCMLVASHSLCAAEPTKPRDVKQPDAAQGVYFVGDRASLLAFRVDPWSEDMHLVHGIGRCAVGADKPQTVYFKILGTYRPSRKHETQGVFVYSQAGSTRTSSVPWSGRYDPQPRSFQWAATVDGRKQPLASLRPWTASAAGGLSNTAATVTAPSATTSLSTLQPSASSNASPAASAGIAPSSPSRAAEANPMNPAAGLGADSTKVTRVYASKLSADDFSDKDGHLDFGKVITHVFTTGDDALNPAAPQAGGSTPPLDREGIGNTAILVALIGLGTEQPGSRELIDALLDKNPTGPSASGGPIRKRAEYPEQEPPRVRDALTRPNSGNAAQQDAGKSLVDEFKNMVPNVVGLSFEKAVGVLWSAGLSPSSIECLGHATDPAKADRVVSQTPQGGSPYPSDRQMKLQWYTDKEPLADPSETAFSSGFQPADGLNVDSRFRDAKTRRVAEGQITSTATGLQNFIYASQHVIGDTWEWRIYATADPMGRKSAEQERKSLAAAIELAQRQQAEGVVRITISQEKQSEAEGILERITVVPTGDETTHGRTYHHNLAYRDFQIVYYHNVSGTKRPLHDIGQAVIEKSQKLIDQRFPTKK